nr:hypothetical protein GCM10020092_100340 [Actinoplanes digitatis]
MISAEHRDIRHLEEGERGGRGEERGRDVRTGQAAGAERPGEDRREEHGEREATAQQERAPVAGAVGDPARDRVDQDVPGLRQQHEQSGDARGDTERVGQIWQKE